MQGYTYFFPIAYAATDVAVYQQDIVVHRSTGTAYKEIAGGLETWHIYVGDHCREDYGDIRFTDSTGAELAYYLWPDYSSESARFCVRLEGATSAGEVIVWYGNPAATTTSNGTNTFLFFDDCEGSDPSDKWIEVAGTGTMTYESDPYLGTKALKVSGYSKYVAGRMDPVTSAIFEARIKQTGVYNSFFTAIGSTSEYTFYAFRPNYGNKAELYKFAAGSPTKSADTTGVSSTTWRRITMIPNPSTAKFAVYVDGTLIINTRYDTGYSGVIGARSGTVDDSDIYLDQILVRAYSATPPAALTFSGEQETAAVTAQAASYLGYAGWKYGQYEFGF